MATIIDFLVFDRTPEDLKRIKELARKGWRNMTEGERKEYIHGNDNTYWLDYELMECLDGAISCLSVMTNKGAYNACDLNRVESAVDYLAKALRELPDDLREYTESFGVAFDRKWRVQYDASKINPVVKTDWEIDDFRSEDIDVLSEMDRYLENIRLLKSVFNYSTVTVPPTMQRTFYGDWNAIEQVLVDVQKQIDAKWAEIKQYIEPITKSWYYAGEVYANEVNA